MPGPGPTPASCAAREAGPRATTGPREAAPAHRPRWRSRSRRPAGRCRTPGVARGHAVATREHGDARRLEEPEVRGRQRQRGGDVDREQHRGGGAEAGTAVVEAERGQQHEAGEPLQRPGRQLRPRRQRAEPRLAEHVQPGAHAAQRVAQRGEPTLHALRPRALARAHERGCHQHGAQDDERCSRVQHERPLAPCEQPDRAQDRPTEDRQRDEIEYRLGHERPEDGREELARPPETARDDQRARRLAEPRRQRRRHQHADRRALEGVREAHARVRQRRLQDRVPGGRPQHHRDAHQRHCEQHPERARSKHGGGDRVPPDALHGQIAPDRGRRRDGGEAQAPRGAGQALGPGRLRFERRQPPRRPAGAAVSGAQAEPLGSARERGHGARVLICLQHLLDDPRPREALRARSRPRSEPLDPRLIERQVAQRGQPASPGRRAGRERRCGRR